MNLTSTVIGLVVFAYIAWAVVKGRHLSELQNRAERHLCLKCGYDLRGSVDRCPECGELATAALDRLAMRTDWPADEIIALPLHPGEATDIIHETVDKDEAWLLCRQLSARGVPAENQPWPLAAHPELTLFRVAVRPDDAQRANGIVRRFRRGIQRR